MFCRICRSLCDFKWQLDILNGQIKANYFECQNCECLQIENPYWLSDVYKDEENLSKQIDLGRFMRANSAFNYINILANENIVNKTGLYLDYGSGENILKNKLVQVGYNALSYDPFMPGQSINCLSELLNNSVDVLIAIEVIEHIADIDSMILNFKDKLSNDGAIILSTAIYNKAIHDKNWNYLNLICGQHVTLWSHKAIVFLLKKLGFNTLIYFPDPAGFLIVGTKNDSIYNKINSASTEINLLKNDKNDFLYYDLVKNQPVIYSI